MFIYIYIQYPTREDKVNPGLFLVGEHADPITCLLGVNQCVFKLAVRIYTFGFRWLLFENLPFVLVVIDAADEESQDAISEHGLALAPTNYSTSIHTEVRAYILLICYHEV